MKRTLAFAAVLALAALAQLESPPSKLRHNNEVRAPRPERRPPAEARLPETFSRLPLRFEENQGQSGRRVKFFSRGPGYAAFFTPTEVVLALQQGPGPNEKNKDLVAAGFSPARLTRRNAALKGGATSGSEQAVVRMKLVGANAKARVVGEDALPGRVNYYLGNEPKKWRTGVTSYAKVRYEQVYPGIDLLYYGNQRQLEYDFIVAPGADPNQIRLRFEGAEGLPGHGRAQHAAPLRIDGQGDLVLQTPAGEIRLRKPVIYQDTRTRRREITGGYVLTGRESRPTSHEPPVTSHGSRVTGHEVAFHVAAYDTTRPLIIDPVLSYSTYLGGSGFDGGNSIALDAEGNIYVTGGITRSRDFPTENPFQPEHGGGPNFYDAFVTKFDASGSFLIYSTYLGGRDDDYGAGIAVDAEGNAYVTGWTPSPDFPTVEPFQSALRGGANAFVTKLDASGSVVYSTYLGGSAGEDSRGIAVDAEGNAYVIGATSSPDFPTAKPFQPTLRGVTDAFLTKFDSTGSALVFSTYLGGDSRDGGWGVAVDKNRNVYVTGRTQSLNFPTVKAFQSVYAGGFWDVFVTKFDASGSALIYSTYLGGSDEDVGYRVAVDPEGNGHVTGGTFSANFPTLNAFQPDFAGRIDAFVSKFDASGSPIYSTYLGGSGGEYGRDIALDGAGNAYVVGETGSVDFPMVDPLQEVYSGGGDVFISEFNPLGSTLIYSTYLGGADIEFGDGIAVDTGGNAYVTGATYSTKFPTHKPFQEAIAGQADAFVAKISPSESNPETAKNVRHLLQRPVTKYFRLIYLVR